MAEAYELDETVNDLLNDLEQDIIAEMVSDEPMDDEDVVWNQAMQWVLDRLKTYRRE